MDPVKQVSYQKNKQKWEQIILDCRRSGLSDRTYMEQNHISKGSFYYWLRKIREDLVEQHPDLLHQPKTAKGNAPAQLVPIQLHKKEDESDVYGLTGIVVEYQGASIKVSASTPMELLRRTLTVVKDVLS